MCGRVFRVPHHALTGHAYGRLQETDRRRAQQTAGTGLHGRGLGFDRGNDGLHARHGTRLRFRGTVRIGTGVRLRNVGRLSGCDIGAGATVEDTSAVEATGRSSFGSGIPAAAVNEAGGREIPLFTGLTSQLAYIIAMYRHRPATVERLLGMAEREFTLPAAASLCTVGPGARISSCGILRNVAIGPDAVVEGASFLSNGTVASHPGQRTYIGPGVKMRDFIVCGNSIIDNGTVAERCFFGNATRASALTATDSLFFAGSHCDNGEACSVLAGPYTISHHKSTLLIAGMFSFFNAGSGTNQSNHLLKSGPVHQGHPPAGAANTGATPT